MAKPCIALHERCISPYPFSFLFFFFNVFFLLHHTACRFLVPPNLGLNPGHSAVKVLRINHWTTRELPVLFISKFNDSVNVLVLRKLGFFCFFFFFLLPWWSSGHESVLQCSGYKSDSWSRKIPHATGQLSLCTMTTESLHPRARAPQ